MERGKRTMPKFWRGRERKKEKEDIENPWVVKMLNRLCQLPIHDTSLRIFYLQMISIGICPRHISFANLTQISLTYLVPRPSTDPSRVELWELLSVGHHPSEFIWDA